MSTLRFTIAVATTVMLFTAAHAADDYQPGPDSKPQPGVPKGGILKFTLTDSKFFPGTRHDYSVYVPAEYTPDKPACVYVGQDGVGDSAPVVFDNLIFKKEMPVTIGVFIRPGVVPAVSSNSLDRYNRSYEYDGLGDNYARFLLEEVLPQVEKITLPDGRAIHLSHDGNDRCIGGQSSGGICAFTVAWEHPQDFSRVFTAIGTFVDLRGGARYPTLIRKFEPRPIRVFLQDGSNDNNKAGGDWWMANQTMERALEFSGYEVNHVWGEGSHSGKHATAIFPDAMRWLWKDWPQTVKGGPTKNDTLASILIPGEGWQAVCDNDGVVQSLAVNAQGEVFFSDVSHEKAFEIELDGTVTELPGDSKRGTGQFGPDGKLYSDENLQPRILAYDPDGKSKVIAKEIYVHDLVVAHNGNIYVTAPQSSTESDPGKIWLIRPSGEKQVVDTGLKYASGITLSPDQSLLYAGEAHSHWVYSYVIQPDGTLTDKQRYYWLHERDQDDDSGIGGMRCDRDGRLYVATRMGIQVCDQAGRVQCIIPAPNGHVTALCFGGAKFDTLFANCGDKIFKRKLNVTGANPWAEPNKPAPPHL